MKAQKITSIFDIVQYINRRVNGNQQNLKIAELEKRAGISCGAIARWKKQEYGPTLEKVLTILTILNSAFLVKDKNAIRKINSQEELMEFICTKLEANKISKSKLEQKMQVSQGMVTRWKNQSKKNKIRMSTAIISLKYLNCETFFMGEKEYETYLEQLEHPESEMEKGYIDEQYLEQLVQHFSKIEPDYLENLCNFIINNTTRSEKGILVKALIDEIVKQ